MIALSSVGRVYPETPPVVALADATLTIKEGEWISIMGPSGAGKTTLLNLIGLLDVPTSGTYLLDGVDVSSLKGSERAEKRAQLFGFVFQAFNLVDTRSVIENVEMGLIYQRVPKKARVQRARAALDSVGLSYRMEARAATLSGGEKQRAAIARAVASDARVLLCDEPTGNLDTGSGELVLDEIARANQRGTTVVVITHDPSVAHRANRIVEVNDGVLLRGRPS